MWQYIDEPKGNVQETFVTSHRLRVQGGWIVRTITSRYHAGTGVAQTFVADPNHAWVLSSE